MPSIIFSVQRSTLMGINWKWVHPRTVSTKVVGLSGDSEDFGVDYRCLDYTSSRDMGNKSEVYFNRMRNLTFLLQIPRQHTLPQCQNIFIPASNAVFDNFLFPRSGSGKKYT